MDLRRVIAVFRSADGPAFMAIVLLCLIGLAAIYSVDLSQQGSGFLNVKKQALSFGIGLIAYFVIAHANYRLLRSYAFVLYVAGNALLLAVLIFGSTIHGTTGWFAIGPFSFQPVEPMKIALAIALAAYVSRRARRAFGWRELWESASITALPVVLVLFQPDIGSAAILLGIWGIVVLVAGVPKRCLAALLTGALMVISFAWRFLFVAYQKARVLTFLHPTADPLGQGYNVTQAMIAVGAGGWFGRGLGFGSQSQLKFLPESQTDFIFAVIAEELGFVGVCLVLGLWLFVLLRLLRQARRSMDPFASYLLFGLGASLLLQTAVHIGMNLGMFPVTGLGLPLVSYGGSSLVFTLFMLGCAESVARASMRRRGVVLE